MTNREEYGIITSEPSTKAEDEYEIDDTGKKNVW